MFEVALSLVAHIVLFVGVGWYAVAGIVELIRDRG